LVAGKLRNEVHGAGILHVSGVGLAEIDEVSSKLRAGVATIDLYALALAASLPQS